MRLSGLGRLELYSHSNKRFFLDSIESHLMVIHPFGTATAAVCNLIKINIHPDQFPW